MQLIAEGRPKPFVKEARHKPVPFDVAIHSSRLQEIGDDTLDEGYWGSIKCGQCNAARHRRYQQGGPVWGDCQGKLWMNGKR